MTSTTLSSLIDEALSGGDPSGWCNRHRDQIDGDFVRGVKRRLDEALRSDARQALGLGDLAIAAATLVEDPALLGLATRGKAQALHQGGACTEAIALYERASTLYAQARDEVEAARTLIGAIDALGYVGRTQEALSTAERCIEVFTRLGEDVHRAKVELNVGNLYHRLDRNSESGSYYASARSVFSRAGDRQMAALADTNLGNVATNLCNFRAARSYFGRAARTLQRLGADIPAAMNEANIGWLDFIEGDFARAVAVLRSVKALFEEHQLPRHVATCNADLAEVYLAMDRLEDAERAVLEARGVFESADHVVDAAKCLTTMGIVEYRRGNPLAAVRLLREAAEAFAGAGSQTLELTAQLLLADVQLRSGDAQGATEVARTAVEGSRRSGLQAKHAHALLLLGRAHLAAGQPREAMERFAAAQELASAAGTGAVLLGAQLGMARLAREMNRPAEAISRFREARAEAARLVGVPPPEEQRVGLREDKDAAYSGLAQAILEAETPDAFALAFEAVEDAKARVLAEQVAGQVKAKPRGGRSSDPALAERVNGLRKQITALRSAIERQQHSDGNGTQKLAAGLRRRLADLEKELAGKLARLEATDPEYVSLVRPAGCKASAVQEILPGNAALVEFFETAGRLEAFVVRRESLQVVPLPLGREGVLRGSSDLAYEMGRVALADKLTPSSYARLCTGADRHLEYLYRELVAPLGPLPRRLIFVVDGALQGIPIHALKAPEGYLIDRHEVSYARSSRSLRWCAERARSAFDTALIVAAAREDSPSIQREVREVASRFERPTVLSGADARVGALRETAGGCDVVHIITRPPRHDGKPPFPGIQVSDEWLSVLDVYTLELDASLVTLSGGSRSGVWAPARDERRGLVEGLLYAGAAAVVTSLWAADDGAAADFMSTFYGALRSGASRAAAMRRAQLKIKSTLRHPYHWAPFVLNGAW